MIFFSFCIILFVFIGERCSTVDSTAINFDINEYSSQTSSPPQSPTLISKKRKRKEKKALNNNDIVALNNNDTESSTNKGKTLLKLKIKVLTTCLIASNKVSCLWSTSNPRPICKPRTQGILKNALGTRFPFCLCFYYDFNLGHRASFLFYKARGPGIEVVR